MRNKAVKKVLSMILTVCLTLTLAPLSASAEEAPLGTSERIVDSGALPDTGTEPQSPPATPSDLPRSPLGISGLSGDMGPLAADTGYARGIVGHSGIQVWLTEGAFVTAPDHTKWTIEVPSGVTITGISRPISTSVVIFLSAPISAGNTFTITSVDPSQFAAGTEPFATPLMVEIRPFTPVPAAGTATATAGTKEIAVTLTSGEFYANQKASYWVLGGTSESGNLISGVTYLDRYRVKIALENDIGEEDDLTVEVNNVNAFEDESTAKFASPLRVEISPAEEEGVCEINGKEYPSLTAALEYAGNGDTIKLLGNITHASPVEVNQELTFDLNGFHLLIDTSGQPLSTALTVGNGGNVGYNTPGTFTVSGSSYGVKAEYGGQASVSGVILKDYSSIGAYAGGEGSTGSRVTVNGEITTPADGSPFDHAVGASASGENANVTVNGHIGINGAQTFGVVALLGGKVEVNSTGGAAIVMDGDSSCGVSIRSGYASEAVVNGGVNAIGNSACGVSSAFGQATINGNVTADGDFSIGVTSWDFGNVTVNGNVGVTGADVTGIRAERGEGAGGTVRVTGNVVLADETTEPSLGVYCYSRLDETKSTVTVDGTVTAPLFLEIDDTVRDKEPPDDTDGIYTVYNGQYGSAVKVGNSAGPSLPAVTTTLVDSFDVTSTRARVRGRVTATGGEEITAFGFAWGLSANPTTANSTAAGTGTAASFAADLTGLVPSQTYYVRAYATNSAGTAYGENRTFTTAASDPLAAPLNLRYLAHDSAVELIWDAPTSSSPISHYEIMRGNDLTKPWTDVGNVTSHMVTGLTNGENYTFNIRAVNADGPGAHNFLWATANIPTPPGPPHSLDAFGYDGRVRVSWSTPYYNGHREITGYLVSTDSSSWIDVGRDRAHEFTGLTNGTTYTFYMRAVNAVGAGEIASIQGTPRATGGGYAGTPGYGGIVAIQPERGPDQPVIAETAIQAGTGADASALITDAMVKALLEAAQNRARNTGRSENGIGAQVNILLSQTAGSLIITMEAAAIDRLESAGVRLFTTGNPLVDFTFDEETIRELNRQTTGAVTISIKPVATLSDAARRVIGSRPAFDLTISHQREEKTVSVSDFGKGRITLGIAYSPRTGGKTDSAYGIGDTPYQERSGCLYAVHVNQDGQPQYLQNSSYDNGRLLFVRSSLSVYGVGYSAPSTKFTDIGSHWAEESIDFVAGRGLLSGTSNTTFSPNTAMTRGMLATALGRLAGVDVSDYETNRFTDVGADSPFRPYIEWAHEKGVVQGIGNGQFAPDRAVTREEIAVIFASYARAAGYTLPVTREAAAYADASGIGGVYKDAVKAMQQAGIMMGGSDNRFNPKATATRAEVSAMLHRYVKLTIDPATAQGWALNDDGQYLYYKNGRALTGWQTIDGIRYFFNTNGTLQAGWVKDGENWRFYSGSKAAIGWWGVNDKRYYFTKDGLMVWGQWLQIDGEWYYFRADGSLARSTSVDGYQVDENGVREAR